MRIILFLAILVSFPVLCIGQTDTENYVKTTAYQVATPDGNVGDHNKQESITYYDGLGRPKQQIAVNASLHGVYQNSVANNLTDWQTWEVGSGDAPGFLLNGSNIDENNRVLAEGPYGAQEIVWICGNDAAANQDGGFKTELIPVDKTQTYRYTIWAKKTGHLTSGKNYHSVLNVANLDGTSVAYAQIFKNDFPSLNEWYLMVGIIHPHDYLGEDTGEAGVYNQEGIKVAEGVEFKWRSGQVNTRVRSFFHGSNNTSAKLELTRPLFQKVDGSESSISILTENLYQDIVTHIEYDALGRQPKEYLPYASGGSGGIFNPTAQLETLDFYDTIKYENTNNPYSETAFESSPLNRPIEQAAPGNIWGLDNEDIEGNHTIKFDYGSNTESTTLEDGTVLEGDDVFHFDVTFQDNNTSQPLLSYEGMYAPQELYKNSTKDENWNLEEGANHTTEEFTNKRGQVLLKRAYESSIPHDTYYVYDDFGNLTYVLSPKASDNIITTPPTHKYSFKVAGSNFSIGKGSYINGYLIMSYYNQNLTLDFDLTMETPVSLRNGTYGSDTGLPDMYIGHLDVIDGAGYDLALVNGLLTITGDGTFTNLNTTLNISLPDTIVNTDSLESLGYEYHYDYRNRLIEKRIPGKAWEYIVYDKLDRPILTQTGNLRETGEWLFTKYDTFGRVTYTGMYQSDTSCTGGFTGDNCRRIALQELVDNHAILEETKQNGAQSINGTTVYYTNNAFPTNISEIHTINYYDNYEFDWDYNNVLPENPTTYSNPYGMTLASSLGVNGTKTLATGSKVRVLGTDNWIVSMTLYDTKARPVYTASYNEYLDTVDESHSNVDFIGNILENTATHIKGGTAITTVDYFEYDELYRLKSHKQQLNDGGMELITQNHYDALGQLTRKDVGGATTSTQDHTNAFGLQKIDYYYNIRGWLKEINTVNDSFVSFGDGPDDLFNFKINYGTTEIVSDSEVVPLYNGNISETLWRTLNESNDIRGYSYEYDALNRIKNAIFAIKENTFAAGFIENGSYNEAIHSYDKNGNIGGLTRSGEHQDSGIELMDVLGYAYEGNRLLRVTEENIEDTNDDARHLGFIDGNTTGEDYSYDIDGNMIEDKNKGITNITYNHLNLPLSITLNPEGVDQDGTISYVYDATGVKLQKRINPEDTDVDEITSYAGGFIYKDTGNGPILEMFFQPEGYVEPDGNEGYQYAYQYKDHLGNVRLTYADTDGDGTIDPDNEEILSEKNYYPFGLEHKGYNNVVTSTNPAQNYTYNGKEKQEELGLNWHDYGARNYDASLGRWMNVDNHADSYFDYSPYSYAINNPINVIDPDGNDIYILTWFSKTGESGHAGIAIDNYKTQNKKDANGNDVLDANGNVVTEQVADGTYTYYDLWPNDAVDPDTELQTDVTADYSGGIQINSLSDLMNTDPTTQRTGNVSAEGRSADGIVQISTSPTDDEAAKKAANTEISNKEKYNACYNNCSTFTQRIANIATGNNNQIDAKQRTTLSWIARKYTGYKNADIIAPNNLYNAALKAKNSKKVKGPANVQAKPYLDYFPKN